MKEFLLESRPSFASYACVDSGAVVGWAALTRYRVREDVRHTAEMSVHVLKSFRGRGIGSALARTLMDQAPLLDLRCVFAMVFKDMPEAAAFAERRCRFSAAGCLPEVFSDSGKHYDILVFERIIVPSI